MTEGRRKLGDRIFGLSVPRQFRGFWLRFESPARVLGDFGSWLESELVVVTNGDEGELKKKARDRQVLVERVIEVSDIAQGDTVRERLRMALAEVGVEQIDAADERFDPNRHMAVNRLPPAAPELDGMVAEVERPGYKDGDEVVRRPEVVVYHRDAPR